MDDNLKIIMSPVQLAAVLSDKDVTEGETLGNRLRGGLGLLAGTLELAGSRALCMTPAGRFLTAACVFVGAHSMDTINASIEQIRTGRDTRTATYRLAVEIAKKFGADDKTAWNIGMAVDVGVPIGVSLALGAVRVASVRIGRIKLIEHESVNGSIPGGHTLSRHVGKTNDELAKRLANSNGRITGAGSFTSVRVAENAISKALKANDEWIKLWASSRPGRNLTIRYDSGNFVGYVIKYGQSNAQRTTKIRVALKYEQFHGKPYYILTAFPD